VGILIQHAPRLASNLLGGNAHLAQHVQRHAFAQLDQTEQKVLGADVMVPHLAGFFDRIFKRTLHARRKIELGGGHLPGTGNTEDHFLHADCIQTQLAQDSASHTAFFLHQAQ
jgi:hypothetical protein